MPSSMNNEAMSSAHPIPSCTARRDNEVTTPAPNQPPTTPATISTVSCSGSTPTALTKNIACAITGSAWPTMRVPGINSSGTRRSSRKTAVVGANDPMPSVSKKFVTKPIARCGTPGPPLSSASGDRRTAACIHCQTSSTPLAVSAPSSITTKVTAVTV